MQITYGIRFRLAGRCNYPGSIGFDALHSPADGLKECCSSVLEDVNPAVTVLVYCLAAACLHPLKRLDQRQYI